LNQSAIIGGTLLAGFALFLSARDRLGAYGRILWGAKPAAHNEPPSKSPTAGAIPGTGNFDPLDIFGNYGLGVGDLFNMDWDNILPSFGSGE